MKTPLGIPMNEADKDTVIGAVVLAALALMIAFLHSGKDVSAVGSDYRLDAVFNQVDGLLPGDEVRLGGVQIGTVKSQSLGDGFQAVVTMNVFSDVKLPLDTSAAIHTDGLFGSKYIVLEPGGEEEALAEGDMITFTQDSLVVSDLLDLIISEGKARLKENKPAEGDKPK
jgi:phospholipid/cholesterol/gamma-HCH transport system substrate-binding protein